MLKRLISILIFLTLTNVYFFAKYFNISLRRDLKMTKFNCTAINYFSNGDGTAPTKITTGRDCQPICNVIYKIGCILVFLTVLIIVY
jgi:hypothetical protein